MAVALATTIAVAYVRRAPQPSALVRASLVLPEKTYIGDVAVSPDGRKVAFTAAKLGGPPALWIRELDKAAAETVAGADEDVRFPFWSPDGRYVAFFTPGKLQRVESHGGAVQTICDVEDGTGGTWGRDGTIVFAVGATSPLFRVTASGGKPQPVTKLDAGRHETAHRYPHFLPDGRHFLYLATDLGGGKGDQSTIRAMSIDGGSDKEVVSVASNVQYAAGRLLYVRDRALVAQRFDLGRLEAEGDPVILAPLVDRWTGYFAFFAFAASDGAVVLAAPFTPPSALLWFDRSGKQTGSLGEAGPSLSHRLSPDGRKVAWVRQNPGKGTSEIWLYDVASGSGSKFVFAPPGSYDSPVWSPDGSRLLYETDRRTGSRKSADLWVKALDGSGETPFVTSNDFTWASDWSRDGRTIAIYKIPEQGHRNTEVWTVDAADPTHQTPYETGAPSQTNARFSPMGSGSRSTRSSRARRRSTSDRSRARAASERCRSRAAACPSGEGTARSSLREQRQQAHGRAPAIRAHPPGGPAGRSLHDPRKRARHRVRSDGRRTTVPRQCGDGRRCARLAAD